jgi:hypothetical protein
MSRPPRKDLAPEPANLLTLFRREPIGASPVIQIDLLRSDWCPMPK